MVFFPERRQLLLPGQMTGQPFGRDDRCCSRRNDRCCSRRDGRCYSRRNDRCCSRRDGRCYSRREGRCCCSEVLPESVGVTRRLVMRRQYARKAARALQRRVAPRGPRLRLVGCFPALLAALPSAATSRPSPARMRGMRAGNSGGHVLRAVGSVCGDLPKRGGHSRHGRRWAAAPTPRHAPRLHRECA
jgi:hypothetical protein